jgi:glycosyltransferase involved in cell wall biosynthesis
LKVLVQIPAKNEEVSIGKVLSSIPRQIEGVSSIKVLVIDDASNDNTVGESIRHGADFVITKRAHAGLASSFALGTKFFLANGFDILVNTDGDNQYFQEKIPLLVKPILNHKADLVVGDRNVSKLKHFSPPKKLFQKIGSAVISAVAGVSIPDAASGFRAYSRHLVARLQITTRFSYAMETLIQAGRSDFRVGFARTGAKPVERPSRLFRNPAEHVFKSGQAILRGLVTYRPLATFLSLSAITGVAGAIPFARYLYLISSGAAGDHLQSLILGVVLVSAAFTAATLAVLSDAVRSQRLVSESNIALSSLALTKGDVPAILAYYDAEIVHEN